MTGGCRCAWCVAGNVCGAWTLVTARASGLALHLMARVVGQECPTHTGLLEDAVVEFLFTPVGGGLDEGEDDGVRLLFGGGQLGLEERREEEAVSRGFDGTDLALSTTGNHRESGFHGGPFEVGIDFEVAEELFGGGLLILAVERLQVGARTQANLRNDTGKLRRIALAVRNGTGNRIDDDVLGAGI